LYLLSAVLGNIKSVLIIVVLFCYQAHRYLWQDIPRRLS
jgi:hypothetical protein